ncbi:hypothetical protein C8Q76DRAFT_184099 [Earliella scabrosa]|nr:hypothetical protein C8Q76DRAFT_184099 [Earliella scabrosa]
MSKKQVAQLTRELKKMMKTYPKRAKREKRKEEDVLAEEFANVINTYLLNVVAGQEVAPASDGQSSNQPRSAQQATRLLRTVARLSRTPTTSSSQKTASTSTTPPAAPASTAATPSSAPDDNTRPQSRLTRVSIVPHYVMRLSPNHADTNDPEGNKADAAIFEQGVELEDDRPNWPHQSLPAEFKLEGTHHDPFDDRLNHDTQSLADGRFKVFGQCAGYVNCVFRYQHRTAVFQLFVIGGSFRFLRWDRSAVFVTQKIDYLTDTRTLVDMILGFLILDAESQGVDPTATLLAKGSPEYDLMDKVAESGSPDDTQPIPVIVPHAEGTEYEDSQDDERSPIILDHVLDYFLKSLVDWPRYRLALDDQNFLVGKPIFESTGLVGRGTRGYVAWHVNSKSFVFLKDAWRPFYTTMEAEGDTVRRLNAAEVINVPTLVCHGNVGNQSTFASHYCLYLDERTNAERKAKAHSVDDKKEKGKKRKADDLDPSAIGDDQIQPRLRHYAHYRICVKEICLPLKEFKSSKQLITVVRDCIDAHRLAVEKCKTIHRDISSGNLLILPVLAPAPGTCGKFVVVWQGILIDWELSKPTPDADNGEVAREPERTGTFSYMSVATLSDPFHITRVADEVESFFNVIFHNALRYLPHNIRDTVQTFIKEYFIDCARVGHVISCGTTKSQIIKSGELRCAGDKIIFQSKPLRVILEQLLQWFRALWEVRQYEQAKKEQAEKDAKARTASTPQAASSTQAIMQLTSSIDRAPADRKVVKFEQPVEDIVAEPSAQTKELAKKLDNHDAVLDLFWSATTDESWCTEWPRLEIKVDNVLMGSDGAAVSPRLPGIRFGTIEGTPETQAGTLERSKTVELFDRPQPVSKKRKTKAGSGAF